MGAAICLAKFEADADTARNTRANRGSALDFCDGSFVEEEPRFCLISDEDREILRKRVNLVTFEDNSPVKHHQRTMSLHSNSCTLHNESASQGIKEKSVAIQNNNQNHLTLRGHSLSVMEGKQACLKPKIQNLMPLPSKIRQSASECKKSNQIYFSCPERNLNVIDPEQINQMRE